MNEDTNFKPTLKEPVNNQSKGFEKNFKKTMTRFNPTMKLNLSETDEFLSENEYSLKKKIFSLAKMETLIFSDPKLSAVYDKMAINGSEKYGYHFNETIVNTIFNDYVLNSPKYLQKYKMAIPKEKKRRDKSGINQLRKAGEKTMAKTNPEFKPKQPDIKPAQPVQQAIEANETTGAASSGAFTPAMGIQKKSLREQDVQPEEDDCFVQSNGNKLSVSCGGKFIGEFVEDQDAFDAVKQWKQQNNFYPNSWFISDHGNISLVDDDGNIIKESTTASSAGGAAGYVGYAGPAAWGSGDLMKTGSKSKIMRKPIWQGGTIIQESNYLIDPSGFEKYVDLLSEQINIENPAVSQKPNVAPYTNKNINNKIIDKTAAFTSDTVKQWDKPDTELELDTVNKGTMEESNLNEKSKSKAQQRFMGMVHAVQKGELSPDKVGSSVEKAAASMSDKDAEDFASTKHKNLPEKIKEDTQTMIQSNSMTMANKAQPLGDQSSNMEAGLASSGGMNESYEKLLEEINNELEAFSIHQNKLMKMSEDRKPSSLVLRDRLGNDNEKNFKSDMKQSGTKEIIDVEKELQYKDQQTDVPDDPQKLGLDIEKKAITNTDAKNDEFLKNVGDSDNNEGDEIPKRNFTTEEQHEVDMMRQGQQDLVFDNKPSKRFEDRMKADMGDAMYKIRQEKMEYKAKAPMYNKEVQPTESGENKVQFDKNKSGWNEREGLAETMVTGRFIDALGKKYVKDFRLNEVKELKTTTGTANQTGLFELDFTGFGNKYKGKTENKKVLVNEGVESILSENKFYTDGINIFLMKNPVQKLNENVQKNEKQPINEQMDKMKHLLGYKPKNFVNTNNVKKNRGF